MTNKTIKIELYKSDVHFELNSFQVTSISSKAVVQTNTGLTYQQFSVLWPFWLVLCKAGTHMIKQRRVTWLLSKETCFFNTHLLQSTGKQLSHMWTHHRLTNWMNLGENCLSSELLRCGGSPFTTCVSWSNTLFHLGYGKRPVASSYCNTNTFTTLKQRSWCFRINRLIRCNYYGKKKSVKMIKAFNAAPRPDLSIVLHWCSSWWTWCRTTDCMKESIRMQLYEPKMQDMSAKNKWRS